VSLILSTACHHPPGTNTVSPTLDIKINIIIDMKVDILQYTHNKPTTYNKEYINCVN
jgi:hypothetical protein